LSDTVLAFYGDSSLRGRCKRNLLHANSSLSCYILVI